MRVGMRQQVIFSSTDAGGMQLAFEIEGKHASQQQR